MAEYAPPPGPPPPKVPSGWVAQFNAQYSEWFYVNTFTKQSQWDKPTEPVYPPGDHNLAPPGGAPPSYDPNTQVHTGPEKLGSNNPYGQSGGGAGHSSHDISEDERLARQLQEEENARAGGSSSNRGASDGYYGQGGPPGGQYGGQPQYGQPQYGQPQYGQPQYGQPPGPGYDQQSLPPRPESKSKGFLGKLMGKAGGSHQQPQGHGGYPPQQGYYGGGGHGGHGGHYGGQPQYVQGRPGKKPGMGAGGAAALGAGGGLLGGLAIAGAMDGDEGGSGSDGGSDYGGDDGGDFGGDDGGGE